MSRDHSKRIPERVSAHRIPGVWQLGRRDEADTPDLPVLMRDIWPARVDLANDSGLGSRHLVTASDGATGTVA